MRDSEFRRTSTRWSSMRPPPFTDVYDLQLQDLTTGATHGILRCPLLYHPELDLIRALFGDGAGREGGISEAYQHGLISHPGRICQ